MKQNEEDIELQEKQNYLRKNIIDKGYNTDEFMNFFKELYNDEDINLKNYSMSQLSKLVQDFFSKKNETFPKIPNDLKSEVDNNSENKSSSSSSGHHHDNEKEDIIRCKAIEKTELSKYDKIEIFVKYPQKVEPGIFSKSYMTYGITTIPLNYNVRKRYTEFEWLQGKLSENFENCITPPLCKKNYMKQFDEDFISKRARNLERFLNGIAVHPLLKNSFIFNDFLSIGDDEIIKNKKMVYEQPYEKKSISDFQTFDGKIKVNLSYDNEIYFQNIMNYVDMYQDLIPQIINEYKNLFELIKNLNEKIQEIGLLWKKLEINSKKFDDNKNTITSYNIMKDIMKNWSDVNNKKVIQMKENIIEFFRYIKNEYNNFIPFSKRVNEKKKIFFEIYEEFYKKIETDSLGSSIMEKIEKYNDIDFSKYPPNNTLKVRDAKNYYCGYLNSLISEYERLKELNGIRIKNNILKIINLFSNDDAEYIEIIKAYELNYGNSDGIYTRNSNISLI